MKKNYDTYQKTIALKRALKKKEDDDHDDA